MTRFGEHASQIFTNCIHGLRSPCRVNFFQRCCLSQLTRIDEGVDVADGVVCSESLALLKKDN